MAEKKDDPTVYKGGDGPAARAEKQSKEWTRQIMERMGIIDKSLKEAEEALRDAQKSGNPKLVAECQKHLAHVKKTKESYERMNAEAQKKISELKYQYKFD